MFKEIKNRDAWSTIRGFVYQVDMTILRWLDLAEDETLELEKGEDIDIVKNALDNADSSRTLEQVKFRESTVSLNTELALELLFNFFIHRQNNPNQKLFYRFVSNAGYNVERPALFEKSKSAIAVWQEVFSEENVLETDERLEIIGAHLGGKIKKKISDPSTTEDSVPLNQQHWADFKTLTEHPKRLLQFIKEFEWSLENPEGDKISTDVKKKILTSPHLSDTIDAEILYSRLFMYVFKLLTNSDAKTLDIAALKLQSLLPALDAQDETLFKIVSELLESLQDRVSIIEVSLVSTLEQIKTLTEDVSEVKSSDAVFEIRLQNLTSTRPVPLQNGSLRATRTKDLLDNFTQTPWINLQGINGTGKTQLALLSCQPVENVYWIELREYKNSSEKSTLYIEAILSFISGIAVGNNRNEWIFSAFEKLPKNSIIVLNDLPEIDNSSPLKALLVSMASNLSKQQVQLLTTSNFKIPPSVVGTLQSSTFRELDDFTFNDDEVQELLVNNGAPKYILKFANLFATVSHRNPQVLWTIINRLVAINWGKDSIDVFEELFKKEFSLEIFKDVQSSISKFITDVQTKELLYRLSLIHWGYSFDIVQAVCQADSKIDSPFEKLQGITNTWIQESGSIYKSSPLIHDLGVHNLSPETLKFTHRAIAHAILKLKNIDLINASRIITSLLKAENFNEAGIILLTLLRSADNDEAAKSLYDWGYLNYWNETEMPREISSNIKAHITLEQIRLRESLGKDGMILRGKLDKIVSEISDASEKTMALIIILANDAAHDIDQYLAYAKFILENSLQLPEIFKDFISPQLLEGFIWMPLQQIQTEEEVNSWLQLTEIYEAKTNVSFYQNEIAEAGVTVLADRIVRFEKSMSNFEPEKLSKRLDNLVNYFYEKGFEIFAANILKERIALQFMVLNSIEQSEKMTIEWSEKFNVTEAKYLLVENLGKLYYNNENNSKSISLLEKAIAFNCVGQATFADTLAYGAAAKSESDSASAVDYMERAVELTRNTPWSSELDVVQMICELGLSYWKNREFKKSYDAFNDALTRLQLSKTEKFGPYWIRLMSWLAHTLGYISADVAKDKLPLHFRNGDTYTKPYQGIFLFNTKDLSDLYTVNKDVLMLAQMAVFSEGVGDIEGAYKWSIRAFDEARKTSDENLVMMVSVSCNQYTLLNFKFVEHFEMAMQFHAVSSHLHGTPEQKYEQASKVDFNEILKLKPSDAWDATEDTIFAMSILPMYIMAINEFNLNDDCSKVSQELLQLIRNYSEKASNKAMWESAYQIMLSIFDKAASIDDLTNRANDYGKNDVKNFQIVCILGCIFLEKDTRRIITQIANIFPYFTKTFSDMPAISRNILVPFVKFYVIKAIHDNFVGSRDELSEIIKQTNDAAIAKENAVQKVIINAIDVCDLVIQGDRKDWLESYKEI